MKSRIKQGGEGKHLEPVMGEEWTLVRLGEVVELLTGFPFKSDGYVVDDNAPRLLRGDNVSQGTLRWDGAKRWPKDAVDEISDYWLREGDIILAMDRPWIDAGLKYASVRDTDLPSLLVQRVARLRGTHRLDTHFLKYVIASKAFTDHILGVQTGTAVPHISGAQIRSFKFLLPPLREQRAITHVLGTLDEKIELNQQMNKTLEAISDTIFKHWFVDFEFPNEGGKPYKSSGGEMVYNEELGNDIPREWHAKPIDEVASFLNGLALQRYPLQGDEEGLPVVKIREMRQGVTESTDRTSSNIPEEYVVDDGDVLFSWSGSLEVVVWASGMGALNQHLFKVTSVKFPKWFYYRWIQRYLPEYRRTAEGKATTMGHILRHHLSDTLVPVPNDTTLVRMDRVLGPILNRQVMLGIESRNLSHIRGMLLPRLMSGRIKVPFETA